MIGTAPATRISPNHAAILAKGGISVEQAQAAGIFSVLTPDGLDKTDLAHLGGKNLTGICFPLHLANGATTYQLRLDDDHVTPDRGKYAQAAGRGALFTVPKGRAHLIGKAGKVLIVEGTKQTVAADLYADPSYLIIGIQGCRNWSKGGVPLSELADLVPQGADVTLAFDADWTSNLNVWTAARDLASHLEVVIGTSAPRLAIIPGGGKLGLDDSLGAVPVAENRPAALQRILDAATTSLGRAPAKKKGKAATKSFAPVIDLDRHEIYDVLVDEDGNTTPQSPPLAGFSVQFVESSDLIDDRNAHTKGHSRGVGHTLLFTMREYDADGSWDDIERELPNVSDEELRNIPALLPLLGAEFTRVLRPTDPAGIGRLEMALRTSPTDSGQLTVAYQRTGWVQYGSMIGYLHGEGLTTADGVNPNIRAQLDDPTAAEVAFPDPTREEEIEAARAVLGALDFMQDLGPWAALEGHALWTLAGGRTRTLLALEGAPGAGKSTLIETHRARLGAAFFKGSLASATSTTIALQEAGAQCHSLPYPIDDVLKRDTVENRAGHVKALDLWSRRAYGGWSAGREKKKRNASAGGRSHVTERADAAEPGFVIVAEQLPMVGEAPESTLERMLAVTVTREGTLIDSLGVASAALAELGASGHMNVNTAGFLRWVAGEIESMTPITGVDPGLGGEDAGKIGAYRKTLDECAAKVRMRLTANYPELNVRAQEIAAGPIMGWSLFRFYIQNLGVITEEEGAELFKRGAAAIAKSQVAWVKRVSQGGTGVLDKIREAVQSGAAVLDATPSGRAVCIGERKTITVDGERVQVVALMPSVVGQLLGTPRAQVSAALASIAVPSSTGKPERTVRIGGVASSCVVIPEELWGGETDEEEEPKVF